MIVTLRPVPAPGFHTFSVCAEPNNRNAAVESTIEACGPSGDRRGGVVWHTQGSGKSFEMLCYAAKAMRSPELANPTIVLITDRNDLDGQLLGVFGMSQDLLRE